MAKEKMMAARELIQQKKYDEARSILNSVNHPKAQEWLDKLDKIAPAKKGRGSSKKASKSSGGGAGRLVFLLVGILVIVAVGVGAVMFGPQLMGNDDDSAASVVADTIENALQPAEADTFAFVEYFPAETALYATIRTDAAYIEALDGVYQKVLALRSNPIIGAMLPPQTPESVMALLDLVTLSGTGADFATSVRPWLGDNASIGLWNFTEGEPVGYAVIDLADRAAAVSFIESNLPQVTASEQDGYTVYQAEGSEGVIALNDAVMIVGAAVADLPLAALPANNLLSSEQFTASVESTPAGGYNIMLYMDLVAVSAEDLAIGGANVQQGAEVLAAISPITIGATILDGDSLTIDMVSGSAAAFNGVTNSAVNPDFLQNVPSNAGVLIHSSNLRSIYDAMIALARTSDPNIDASVTQMEEGIMQATGLNLQEDILSWLTSDYALYVSYNVPEAGQPSIFSAPDQVTELGLEFGLVVAATDPQKAQSVVDALSGLLQVASSSLGTEVGREEIGGANAFVLNAQVPPLAAPLQVVLGSNDRVFFFGTRGGAEIAFSGSGGLNGSGLYQNAQRYLLPNANSVWYLDNTPLIAAGDAAASPLAAGAGVPAVGDPATTQQTGRDVAALLESTTISTSISDTGRLVLRAVLTLGE